MTEVYPAGEGSPFSPSDWRDRWMAYREEIEEEQRLEEERRERLEALPPEYVIHIVHGTFARKALWIEPNSNFSTSLRKSLYWRAKIEPFHWSGKNGAFARWQGAQKLEHHLRESIRAFPQAHHIVIAHSHGGNIALWAIRDPLLASKILGVATLSTPFFRHGSPLQGGGVVVGESMRKYAVQICSRMPATFLAAEQVAILRVEGDEATAAITGVAWRAPSGTRCGGP